MIAESVLSSPLLAPTISSLNLLSYAPGIGDLLTNVNKLSVIITLISANIAISRVIGIFKALIVIYILQSKNTQNAIYPPETCTPSLRLTSNSKELYNDKIHYNSQ